MAGLQQQRHQVARLMQALTVGHHARRSIALAEGVELIEELLLFWG